MTSSWFDPGSTSKTLNLSLLRFNERSGFQNNDSKYIWSIRVDMLHSEG